MSNRILKHLANPSEISKDLFGVCFGALRVLAGSSAVIQREAEVSWIVGKSSLIPPRLDLVSSYDVPKESSSSDSHEFMPTTAKVNVEVESELLQHVEEKENIEEDAPRPTLNTARVPSSSIERAFRFGGLAVSMAYGRLTSGSLMSERNAKVLTKSLSRMRGAALKLGQMLSIVDDKSLPAEIREILSVVRNSADCMPDKQLRQVLCKEWGENWMENFEEFDIMPIAAASIGQVHKAKLKNGEIVAVKVQYPGVADGIESDFRNLSRLLSVFQIVPKGLYVDNVINFARNELMEECDYRNEAKFQSKFREMFIGEKDFYVPKVFTELSTDRILVTELVKGEPLDKAAKNLDQKERNDIATKLLRLCLREFFEFRFMQTDPNWSNFLYQKSTGRISMIDFGAAKSFERKFAQDYLNLVYACAEKDELGIIDGSKRLGLLSGEESPLMLKAHVQTGFLIGEPFASFEPYDFRGSNLSERFKELLSVQLKHRIKAPPFEIYGLHRRLSGSFLTCIELDAKISCRQLFLDFHSSFHD